MLRCSSSKHHFISLKSQVISAECLCSCTHWMLKVFQGKVSMNVFYSVQTDNTKGEEDSFALGRE